MSSQQTIKPGDTVRFAEPMEAGEEALRMRVLEVNGDRLLVEDLIGMAINPTTVVRAEWVLPIK